VLQEYYAGHEAIVYRVDYTKTITFETSTTIPLSHCDGCYI